MNIIRRKLDVLDDKMMQCWHMENNFQLGFSIGMLYQRQMQSWYDSGCKGNEPERLLKHSTEYYQLRHYRKLFRNLAKGLK